MTFHIETPPAALRGYASSGKLRALWRKIATTVFSPRILKGLPKYAADLAQTFFIDPADAVQAIRNGDAAFFVAFSIRLDQIDCAMVAAGRTLGERAPVVRSKYLVDGFRLAAEEQLRKRGGQWPPTPDPHPERVDPDS